MNEQWQRWWQAWSSPTSSLFTNGRQQGPTDAPFRAAYSMFEQFAKSVSDALRRYPGVNNRESFTACLERLLASQFGGVSGFDAKSWGMASAPWLTLWSTATGSGSQNWSDLGRQWSKEWLELPPLGPQREWIKAQQKLTSAVLDQQQAGSKLQAHYQQVMLEAVRRFGQVLRDPGGPPITTVSALYDIWIDTCEASYRDAVMTPQFSDDFAQFVNADSATRQAAKALYGRLAALVDLPQPGEIIEAHERIARLEREVAALHAANNAPDTNADKPKEKAQAANSVKKSTPEPSAVKKKRTPKAVIAPTKQKKRQRSEFDIGDILKAKD